MLHHFYMQNLYISLSMPPKLLFVFSTKIYSQFSTLQRVGDLGLLNIWNGAFLWQQLMTRNSCRK